MMEVETLVYTRPRREDDEEDLKGFIKISSKEEPKHYAGKLAWNARNKTHMPLLATGPTAINCAIKAVAIARRYLEEDHLELLCQPAFRDRNMGASLALYLSSIEAADVAKNLPPQVQMVELTVSKNSKPQVVAGAIAARARENSGVTVAGIGAEAVCKACIATCHARLYLEENGLDLRAIPVFEEVDKDSGDGTTHRMTALKLQILIESVS